MAPKENGLLKRIADALERLAPTAVGPQAPAKGQAFVWEPLHGGLVGVAHVASLPLSLLKGIDAARDALLENTRRFASGQARSCNATGSRPRRARCSGSSACS